MNGKDLLEGLGFVEDALIAEAEARRRRPALKWLGAAACFCVMLGSLFLLWKPRPDNAETMHPELGTTLPETNTQILPQGTILLRVEGVEDEGFLATVLQGGILDAGSRVTVTMEAGDLETGKDLPACQPGDQVLVTLIRYDEETNTVYAESVTKEETS